MNGTVVSWWDRNIIEPGKLPLFLCAVAFLATFAVTRTIVRSIRAGRGPFGNLSAGGVHIHHVVPGTVLMVAGGVLALASLSDVASAVAGAAFGIGLALVLDEFALILHLDDVYWSSEGRVSVDAVFLVGGLLLLLLLGITPAGVDGVESEVRFARWILVGQILALLACTVVACLKGKVMTAVIGLFVPFVSVVAAARLARPRSPWARWRYPDGSARLARAERRAAAFDRRWGRLGRRLQDLVAGAPGAGTAAQPGAEAEDSAG